jgi:SAM-dependent methyltransferase
MKPGHSSEVLLILNGTKIKNHYNSISWHDKIAKNWDNKYTNSAGFKERYEVFSKLIHSYSKSDNCVYDLGCGTGTFSFLAVRFNSCVFGVDASSDMIDICNQKKNAINIHTDDNIKFINYDILDIEFERNADLIIASSIFEYIDNLELILGKFRKYLNKNGVIIFSLPNYISIHRIFERLSFNIFGYPRYYALVKQSMSLKRAVLLTQKSGYEVLETKYFTRTPYLPRLLKENYLYELFIIVAKKNET